MLPIERGDRARATCFYHVLRVVEPEAHVIDLDWVWRGVLRDLWNTLGVVERIICSGSFVPFKMIDECTTDRSMRINLSKLVRHLNPEEQGLTGSLLMCLH